MFKAIPHALRRHQFSKIEFPDEIKMAEWAHMIERREPMATDVIGFMDGLSLLSECNSNTYEQNAMYNGYHADTMVNNAFAYGADGKVFLCGLNFPGSYHDGSITANLLPIIIEKMCLLRYALIKVFPGAVMQMVFWFDLTVKDQQPDFCQFYDRIY
jgi:flavoprotein